MRERQKEQGGIMLDMCGEVEGQCGWSIGNEGTVVRHLRCKQGTD